ncbi:MAG: hypothetical protein OIF50_16180 [Flavobacteriaceae bacterium]|nr:hypothetical protein [Flavobacteriaceae bacterium]
MKISAFIYLMLIVIGGILIGISSDYQPKEYPMSVGFVLLMFGIYKTTQLVSRSRREQKEPTDDESI